MAAVSSAQTATTTLTPPASIHDNHGHSNGNEPSWGNTHADDHAEVRQCALFGETLECICVSEANCMSKAKLMFIGRQTRL